jgi:hypothetical protein
MRHSFPLNFALAALAALASACGSDTTAPAAPPRSYQLIAYGGAPLPVTLRRIVENSTIPGGPTTTCDDRLTASDLDLFDARQFVQTDSRLLVCDDGRPNVASQEILRGSYATGADTLVLDADLGGAGAEYVSVARVSHDSLTVYRREARSGTGATSIDPTELVFRHVGRLMATPGTSPAR